MQHNTYYIASNHFRVKLIALFSLFVLVGCLLCNEKNPISHKRTNIQAIDMKKKIVQKVKRQNVAAQFTLKRKQIFKLIDVSGPREAALIALMGLAGLRREEAVTLEYKNIDFDKMRLTIAGKGKKIRVVPFEEYLENSLNVYLFRFNQEIKKKKNFYLFPSRYSATKPLNLVQVNRLVAQAGEYAGLKNPNPYLKHINPHILRHSYAHYLKSKNIPLEVIRDILGHSSILITADQYGRRSLDEIQKILKTT